jgi:demethylmenaquinone methyltransferase/2-methoxy-6-polyprenyl-1,4-benzoquinol methylase
MSNVQRRLKTAPGRAAHPEQAQREQAQGEQARGQAQIAAYYSDPARRASFVRDLFNSAAEQYDGVNRLFSLGSGAWYRRSRLRRSGLWPGARVVDIAVGTGLLAREAASLTGDSNAVIGVDISEAMLAIAQRKLHIPLIQAESEALPLAPGIADFVTMGYALRHVADLPATLREALRILRPGGTIVLLEISAPSKRLNRILAAAYIGGILPLLSLLLTRDRRARVLMRYHWKTIAACPPPKAVMQALTEAGFCNVACASELSLFWHTTGKKPALEP